MGVKSEAQAGQGTGLPSAAPPPRSKAVPALGDAWAEVKSGRFGYRDRHWDKAPGQGAWQVGPWWPPCLGRTGGSCSPGLSPSRGLWAFGCMHALVSRHKCSFFLGGPRAQEASLGHGAVQPKNVRDLHLRDCALFIEGLYLFGGGVKGTK